MPVRVLWVVKGLGPGGAERLLVAAARAHDPQRVQVECAYVLPHKDHLVAELEAAGVRCTCLATSPTNRTWPFALRRLIAGGRYDIVHAHSPLPAGVARLMARTLPPSRRPVTMSTEHNTWARHRAPTRWMNRLTSPLDAATIAVSEDAQESMSGSAAGRAVVLRHGIEIAATAAQAARREEIRAELGVGPEDVLVGMVAHVTRQKDYPNLLAATRRLLDWGVPVRVVAVGHGPLLEEMRARAAELGLADTVTFTGLRPDAVAIMAGCDIVTLASAWEGLPVTIMEALALGKPIVATAVGGVAEELHDGVDALLVPPGDSVALAAALRRAIEDPALRERLATAAATRAPEFDVRRAVATIEDIYERLAEGRGGAGHGPTGGGAGAAHATSSAPLPAAAPARWVAGAASSERPRGPRAELPIRLATPEDRPQVLDLLQSTLGARDPRYPDLFAWKHDRNPFGPSDVWVATDGGRVVAVRVFLKWEFVRGGGVVRAVRAVDTATDVAYQGRGLFTALTLRALEKARADGIAFVFSTPNAKSGPGNLKLGWQVVGQLPAVARFAGPRSVARVARARVPAERWSAPLDVGVGMAEWLDSGGLDRFVVDAHDEPTALRELPHNRALATSVDANVLRWRYGEPLLAYRVVEDDGVAVVVRARRRGPATELALVWSVGPAAHADRLAGRALRAAGTDYVLRLGAPRPAAGFVPLPGAGPVLTWRAVQDAGMPPLSNWLLGLGDIELF